MNISVISSSLLKGITALEIVDVCAANNLLIKKVKSFSDINMILKGEEADLNYLQKLNDRQKMVIELSQAGVSLMEVSRRMGVSKNEIRSILGSVFKKLVVKNKHQALLLLAKSPKRKM
jgi:DNA-binding CsgD family transcriptional regulator